VVVSIKRRVSARIAKDPVRSWHAFAPTPQALSQSGRTLAQGAPFTKEFDGFLAPQFRWQVRRRRGDRRIIPRHRREGLLRLFAPLIEPLGQGIESLDGTDDREGHARPIGALLRRRADALRCGWSSQEGCARQNQRRWNVDRFHTLQNALRRLWCLYRSVKWNWAPLRMPAGQREVTVFSRV
jgi:hypothetical protein